MPSEPPGQPAPQAPLIVNRCAPTIPAGTFNRWLTRRLRAQRQLGYGKRPHFAARPVSVCRWRAVQRKTKRVERRLKRLMSDPRAVIRIVFGQYAGQALSVASCESGFRTTAVHGQYLGLFQMGSHERATYGHGSTALEQARAAWRYFVASGRDWSPWECKP